MEQIKKEILKILIKNQETCKIGSDGEYSQEQCVFAWDFDLVSDEISSFIQSVFDSENQPNQLGIKNPFESNNGFEKSVEPAIRYLLKNHNPHTKIFIDYDNAELLIGDKNHSLTNEVPD